jgi:protein-S-isoprenylcysteine O-methyltransferase Ste14
MSNLELKVPPLIVALTLGVMMWAIDWFLPLASNHSFGRTILAIAIFGSAVAITATAILGFRKAETTVNPTTPEAASAIVTTGVYRLTRNPMYLGFLLALLAWAVFLGNIVSAMILVLFVAYMNRFQISPEERALRARFGEPYEAYLRSVRRWL